MENRTTSQFHMGKPMAKAIVVPFGCAERGGKGREGRGGGGRGVSGVPWPSPWPLGALLSHLLPLSPLSDLSPPPPSPVVS
jgi:hypothetical protein